MILDPRAGTLSWHRVRYDVAAVQRAMRVAGLPAPLVGRLYAGL
jgi:hypothetical protein